LRNLIHAWEKPSNGQWFWGWLAVSVLLFAVLMAACSSEKQNQVLQPEPTATVSANPTPAPGCSSLGSCEGCPIGHIDRAAETICLRRYRTISNGGTSFQRLNCKVMLQPGDVVEITGGPETIPDPLYNTDGQYCTVIYAEDGEEWFVSWDACMYQTALGERPLPNFGVGETVLLGYNFQLRSSPAGPAELDDTGWPIIVFGHWSAVITDGPALADGRYWYQVDIVGLNLTPGWVPAEFEIGEEG
jgi:hypothetical protein